MNNLFVVHTQYSLILATGLSKGRFETDINDLILFKDFKLSPELANKLDVIFAHSLFLDGTFPKTNQSTISKIKKYNSAIKMSNAFMRNNYDRVFIVLDMNLPEMHIMKKAYSLNPSVKFIALEDGSYPYFLNYATAGGLDSNVTTRMFRKFLFKYILGCGKFYSFEGRFMGANTWLKEIYLTYKDYARDIYKNKLTTEITTKEFNSGIDALFPNTPIQLKENAILLILDKLDVYKDLDAIKSMLTILVQNLSNQQKLIYFKYHPRENMNLTELEGQIELDRTIGIESFYKGLKNKNPLIIGIKSTGLQTAKKMGFNTISLAKIADEHSPDVINFYKNIGVQVIEDLNELKTFAN